MSNSPPWIHSFLTALIIAGSLPSSNAEERAMGTIAFPSLGLHGWDLYLNVNGEETLLLGEDENEFNAAYSPDGQSVAFVKVVHGNLDLYVHSLVEKSSRRLTRVTAMDDRPAWSPDGNHLAFVSTRQPNDPGKAWTGIYSMDRNGENQKRLSPDKASDYSPAWSPSMDWIAFASGSGYPGGTDLYLMKSDGTERRRLIENGGWPTFINGGDWIAFHRYVEGRRWEIWRIGTDGAGLEKLVDNASMPSANFSGTKLAFVGHQEKPKGIQILDLESGTLNPFMGGSADYWNPTLAPDGASVIYHRTTEGKAGRNVEFWESPPGFPVNLLRVTGGFPVFSPDLAWIAVTTDSFSKLEIMRPDGTDRHAVYQGRHRTLFGLSWLSNPSRLAFSEGTTFAPAVTDVKLRTIDPAQPDAPVQTLLEKSGNSGFPSPSPDGRKLVFRAENNGQKNLFILDLDMEKIRPLTQGNWTDTMPHWSPTGEWIAFSSTRDKDYEIWMIRPDGSGIHKLIGGGGRNTHPQFSPDGEWVVFASQRAGFSAESVSFHSMPQAYGDLFAIRIDGTQLTRLTHNAFEEGTPVWVGLKTIEPSNDAFIGQGSF